MIENWLIWLILAGILLIIEVSTLALWALCLAVAAVVAMCAALMGGGTVVQISVFLVAIFAAYLMLMPIFRKRRGYVSKSNENARTGMDALLGRRAVVTKEIRPGELGRARIDGDSWQVRVPGGTSTVERGREVVVTGYDSIILEVADNDGRDS